jgi:hypothetical protein
MPRENSGESKAGAAVNICADGPSQSERELIERSIKPSRAAIGKADRSETEIDRYQLEIAFGRNRQSASVGATSCAV